METMKLSRLPFLFEVDCHRKACGETCVRRRSAVVKGIRDKNGVQLKSELQCIRRSISTAFRQRGQKSRLPRQRMRHPKAVGRKRPGKSHGKAFYEE
ncbi:hypothetical protein V5799_023744 [Amblyomma americanum]|uniref:Uncharacterized protein n=1 Tax=Amblyomma americanum TaxID=6943 RepID=A0AAQ4FIQ6_AMBAM